MLFDENQFNICEDDSDASLRVLSNCVNLVNCTILKERKLLPAEYFTAFHVYGTFSKYRFHSSSVLRQCSRLHVGQKPPGNCRDCDENEFHRRGDQTKKDIRGQDSGENSTKLNFRNWVFSSRSTSTQIRSRHSSGTSHSMEKKQVRKWDTRSKYVAQEIADARFQKEIVVSSECKGHETDMPEFLQAVQRPPNYFDFSASVDTRSDSITQNRILWRSRKSWWLSFGSGVPECQQNRLAISGFPSQSQVCIRFHHPCKLPLFRFQLSYFSEFVTNQTVKHLDAFTERDYT